MISFSVPLASNASNPQAREDLSRHLQQEMSTVLERQMRTMSHVLSLTDVARVLFDYSIGAVTTVAATIAANADGAGRLFDAFLADLSTMLTDRRDVILAKVKESRGW